jgi:hypothetical protein
MVGCLGMMRAEDRLVRVGRKVAGRIAEAEAAMDRKPGPQKRGPTAKGGGLMAISIVSPEFLCSVPGIPVSPEFLRVGIPSATGGAAYGAYEIADSLWNDK